MAGIHQYSSSLFIQSGSAAEFKTGVTASEITVEGTVFATEYKKLDGSLITGTSNIEFFAGSGSGVSRSLAEGGPFSQDHFFIIEGDNKVTENNIDVLAPGLVKIETTGSSTFNPNYFNFIKVGDNNEDLTTVQQGSISSYTPTDISERQAGTHRYIIYAAQTGSSGETHQVFHTVTLDAFVNERPVIIPVNNTTFTIPITHDNNTGNVIIHSTESTDANIEAGEEDFFTKYKTHKASAGGTVPVDSGFPSYGISSISHLSDFLGGQILSETSPGIPPSSFFFTASLTSFNILKTNNTYPSLGRTFIIQNPNPLQSTFEITVEDNYPNDTTNPGTATVTYKISITPPGIADINNSRVEFESSGFTNELTSTLEQTLLYDFDHTLDSSSISILQTNGVLHDRYTSSLVRLKALADITEPNDGLNPPFDHYTKFHIQSQSEGNNINLNNPTLAYFRINGNEQTASAVDLSSINGTYSTTTESNGFKSFEFYPNYTNNTESLVIGTINENTTLLNNTNFVQHGTYDHFQASLNNSPSTLILKRPHDINISDISIEVASGSYEPIPSHQLTSSLLYGFTSSLLSSQTQSLIIDPFPDVTTTLQNRYLSQSIVKLRVKAKITEPFGPTHNGIDVTLDDNNGKSKIFTFSTSSQFFDVSPTYENVNGQELLVGRYTSSWQEFKFDPKNGNYEFGVLFSNPSSNVGLTTSDYISASITMSNAEPVLINNVKVELESGSFATNIGHSVLSSSLLYGLTSSLTSSQTESFLNNSIIDGIGNSNYKAYVSQSIVRARIHAKITEPFGPSSSAISASIKSSNLGFTIISDGTPFQTNLPDLNDSNHESILEGTINISNSGINPQFLSTLPQIFLTQVDIRGTLGFEHGNTLNKQVNRLILGGVDIHDLFTSNQSYTDANGNSITTITNPKVVYNHSDQSSTWDSNANSWGNNNPFAPIFIGNQLINLSDGNLTYFIRSYNIDNLQIQLTFSEPASVTSPFESSPFLFQSDQSDNYSSSLNDFFITPANPTGLFIHPPQIDQSSGKKITEYVSPFIEIPSIPSGTFDFTHKFTSESTVHTTSLDLSNAQSSEVSMSGVGPTLFKDIRYEIETHGYSETGTLTAPRTVLYGDQGTIIEPNKPHTYASSESAVWSNGTARAAALASQSVSRFRQLVTIEEPFGPGRANPNTQLILDRSLIPEESSPLNINNPINLPVNQNILLQTDNENNLSSSISNYVDGKLRTAITTSWIGKEINSLNIRQNLDETSYPVEYKISSSITYNMDADWEPNNSQIVSATDQTTLNLFNVPKTELLILKFLTEEEAYSEVESENTTRTVLYGDPSITNDGTGSFDSGHHFAGHVNSIPYASSSVTRFKYIIQLKEPVGHQHTFTVVNLNWLSSVHENISTFRVFTTSSQVAGFQDYGYFPDNRLHVIANIDYIGQILSSSNQGGTTWTYTGSLDVGNFRGIDPSNASQADANITVYDTPNAEIIRGIPLIETFGDSEIGVSNENIANFANQNRTLLAGNNTTFGSSDGLVKEITGSAVLRIQNQLKIIEPLGYAHKNITSSKFIIKNTDGTSLTEGPEIANIFEYNTSSANLHTAGYNENFLLTSSYTSSFGSGGLALPEEGYVYQHDSVNFSFETPNEESLNANNTSKQLAFKVNEPSAVTITNFFIEVENNNSGSNEGNRSSRSTQILFGKSETENNITTNNSYPNPSSKNQLVSARVLLSCLDPIGTTHFTPTVTIKGDKDEPTITFSTESSPDYSVTVDADTSNGVLAHYTSSFFPLRFSAGNNQIISASALKVDDLGTVFTTSSNSNLIDIDVAAPPSTNINVTDLNLGGEVVSNNYIYESDHASDQIITVDPVFTTGQPTLRTMADVVFDNHLDIRFSDDSLDHEFNNENPSNGTGSLEIDVSDIKNNIAPETFNITATVSETVANSNSDLFTEVITIIPAKPSSMNGNDFATKEFKGHPAGMEDTLYTGDLPSDIGTYKSGHNQTSTITPTTVTNIYKTGLGEGDNIILHTHTNGTANYTGTYGDSNLAYNFGDQGVINLIINGVTKATYNLGTSFDPNLKTGNQGTKTVNFTEGSLVINNIQPFNAVSQNITDKDGVNYPYGYQAWDATVNIDTPLRSGYNTVKLQHTFSDGKSTQETTLLDWYYDDGTSTPTVNFRTISSFSGDPTFYRSGVRFFNINTNITVDTLNVGNNISHNTIKDGDIAQTDAGTNMLVEGVSSINHSLSSISNKNKLSFGSITHLTPISGNGVKFDDLIVKRTSVNSTEEGTLGYLNFNVYQRNNSSTNSWNLTTETNNITIGRFNKITGTSPTNIMEDFRDETYRKQSNYSTAFDSTANILNTSDLLQTPNGKLKYPSVNYSSAQPNSIDYSSPGTGFRHYYRILTLTSADFGGSNLSNIGDGFNLSITATDTIFNNTDNVRIEIKLPGHTEFGILNSESTLNGANYNDINSEGWLAFNSNVGVSNGNTSPILPITLYTKRLGLTSGVIHLRISINNTFGGVIDKIEITT